MKIHPFSTLRVLAALTLLAAPSLHAQMPMALPTPTPPIQSGGEVAAAAAAEVWIGLVDDGQFEKSWDTAAKILQGVVTKKDWVDLATAKRPPLGKVVSRKMASAKPAQTLPGAPEGNYVVIQYSTEFEHKKVAAETMTLAMDGGQWKVSGYYIR